MGYKLPAGFYTGGYAAGLKRWDKEDVGLIHSECPAAAAGIFTVNKFQAAPVLVCKENIGHDIIGILVNSGCANACTGKTGYDNAHKTLQAVSRRLNVRPDQILPASTGVIGQQLDTEKVSRGVELMETGKQSGHIQAFARSIMTTDTFPKIVSRSFSLHGETVTITAFCKGAGMIAPNMATMLAFILTDAGIKQPVLQGMLSKAADSSFHCITVDGDMSTNDSVICLANGSSAAVEGNEQLFYDHLEAVMQESARLVVKDGEGATKLVTIRVNSAPDRAAARGIAMKIASSNLVKTALFGEDANWGRIVSAAGSYSGHFQSEKMQVFLGPYLLFENLVPIEFSEDEVAAYLKSDEVEITVKLNQGTESAVAWTCDFSYDYVKINADYRT